MPDTARSAPSRRQFCLLRRRALAADAVGAPGQPPAAVGILVAMLIGGACWVGIGWLVVSGNAGHLLPVALIAGGAIAARLAVLRRRTLHRQATAALRPLHWDPIAPTSSEPVPVERPVVDLRR